MKKSIVILLVIISILVSSCAPQVTVTSEVTVTLPTATQTPEPSATQTAVYTSTPAQETIKNASGIGFVLGGQVAGQPVGVKIVTDTVPPDAMDAKKKTDFETRINPMTYGFAEGETRVVYIPTEDGKGRVELRRTSDLSEVIAVFGSKDFDWDMTKMIGDDGVSVISKVGFLTSKAAANSAGGKLIKSFMKIFRSQLVHDEFISASADPEKWVPFNLSPTDEGNLGNEGYVYFLSKDTRTLLWLHVTHFRGDLSFIERAD